MNKIFRITVIFIFAFVCIQQTAIAQNYKGDYSSTPNKTKENDEAASPIPKIFSSKITSIKQAEKLDVIYNDLLTSLWLYASTDFTYQKAMMSNMEDERFLLTRYGKEFSGDLHNSLGNLNKNYKNMMNDIKSAKDKYTNIRENIRTTDQEKLDKLWDSKISKFKLDAKKYFNMQHKFLNFYKDLVNFILKEGGKYYYDNDAGRVVFYNFGGYEFFGKSIDKLNKIHYEQIKLLRKYQPANTDINLK